MVIQRVYLIVLYMISKCRHWPIFIHPVVCYRPVVWWSDLMGQGDTGPAVAECWTNFGPTCRHRWASVPSIKRRWVVQKSTHGEGMPNPVDGRVWRNNLVSGFALLANSNAAAGVLLVDWIPASSPIPRGQYPVLIRANTTTFSMWILNYSPHSLASEVIPA